MQAQIFAEGSNTTADCARDAIERAIDEAADDTPEEARKAIDEFILESLYADD